MSRFDKLKERFLRKPAPKNLTWNEFQTFMGGLGYEEVTGRGPHTSFYNKDIDHYVRGVPKPHPGNEIKANHVRNIVSDLIDAGALTDE